MPKKPYNVRAVFCDLDGIMGHVRGDSTENSIDISSCEANDSRLYFFGKDRLLWDPNVICKVGDFLSSIMVLNLPISIVTNIDMVLIKHLISLWPNVNESDFNMIISGDTVQEFSASEKDIIFLARKMQVDVSDLLIVGNRSFHSKLKAVPGIFRLILTNSIQKIDSEHLRSTFITDKLSGVLSVIKKGILLQAGKLPNIFLRELLSKYKIDDSSLIVGPSVGEDTAAVDISGDEILVLKSDPITFATDNIGYYAVVVNSNDMATSGAMVKWILTTIMLPSFISLYKVQEIFAELYKTCSSYNIVLCGGHTEITNAVSRPVIVCTVMGTIRRKKLIDKRRVKMGDILIMTKGAALEGTAIIASEFRELLLDNGMSDNYIDECLKFRSQISILNEAKIAWENPGVSALHDVTEGGLLTAVAELSESSNHGINVLLEDIVIYPETTSICDLFKINPLGLIGSGSLLICCRSNNVDSLLVAMKDSDIEATIIGKITEKGADVKAFQYGKSCRFPYFEVDEITRLFN